MSNGRTSVVAPQTRVEVVDVLFTEDDPAYARFIAAMLRERGLSFRRAEDCADTLKLLERGTVEPRCLLMDLVLTDGDGLELCETLKSSPRFQRLPIVVITGTNAAETRCLDGGAVHFLRKGSDEGALAAVIRSVIAQDTRSRGIVDAGDLHLDPAGRKVLLAGRPVATLAAGAFAALLLLVKLSPGPVDDEALYLAFLEKKPYHLDVDSPITIRKNVKTNIFNLRHLLGPLGSRIVRVRGQGYAYRPE